MADIKAVESLAQMIRAVDGAHDMGAVELAEAMLSRMPALAAPLLAIGTPSSIWSVTGEPDPHGSRYDCERAALVMGDLSDDELANAVFLHGNEQPTMAQLVAGAVPPIAYLTAAKDRIRWLSRALVAAQAQLAAPAAPAPAAEDMTEQAEEMLRAAREAWVRDPKNGGVMPEHKIVIGVIAQALAAQPSLAGQGDALADEIDLIRAVLDGYPESIARSDALRATRVIRAALAASQPVGQEPGAPGPYLDESDAPGNPLWKRLRSIANWLTVLAPNSHMEAAELLLTASARIKRHDAAPPAPAVDLEQFRKPVLDSFALFQEVFERGTLEGMKETEKAVAERDRLLAVIDNKGNGNAR